MIPNFVLTTVLLGCVQCLTHMCTITLQATNLKFTNIREKLQDEINASFCPSILQRILNFTVICPPQAVLREPLPSKFGLK